MKILLVNMLQYTSQKRMKKSPTFRRRRLIRPAVAAEQPQKISLGDKQVKAVVCSRPRALPLVLLPDQIKGGSTCSSSSSSTRVKVTITVQIVGGGRGGGVEVWRGFLPPFSPKC